MLRERFGHESELPDLSSIPAFVLCGGAGTRISALTSGIIPKSLVQIEGDKKLLDYPMDLVVDSGIKNVIICASHLSEKIIRHYEDSFRNLSIQYPEEPELLGVLGSFRAALKNFDPKTDFFLLHGDEIILGVSLREMFKFHLTHGRIATGLLSKNPRAERTVLMKIEENGLVSDAIRGSNDSLPDYVASLGLFIFRPEIKNEIDRFGTWEEMIKTLCHEGKVYGFLSEADFFNINSPMDVSRFLDFRSR